MKYSLNVELLDIIGFFSYNIDDLFIDWSRVEVVWQELGKIIQP